jgi:DNA-binding XRE family transcriptional regulator
VKNNIQIHLSKAKKKGNTATEIIDASGIGRTSFYEIMSGKQNPKLDTAICIARALNASVEEIFPQLKEVLRID